MRLTQGKVFLGFMAGILAMAMLFASYAFLTPQRADAAPTAVQVSNGGTGTTTTPAYGQVLVGNKNSGYDYVATSTFGGGSTGNAFGYLFAGTGNSTSSPIMLLASTTIGAAGQATGLTISGGSTTTLNAYFAGNIGIGTTTPGTNFGVTGSGLFSSNVTAANFIDTTFNGNACIGETSGVLNNSNCVSSLASSGGTLTISSPTGNVNADFNLAHSNTWTVLQQFTGNASSTQISIPQKAYFGSTATTTIDSAGNINDAGNLTVTGNASTSALSANILNVGQTGTTTITSTGFVGIASSTPYSSLSVGSGTASSTITVAEYAYGKSGNLATSTTQVLTPQTSANIYWPIGTSATTLTLCNFIPGQHLTVHVQNPNAVAGALTWNACTGYQLYWAGATTPTQTTTANQWDIWSFTASANIGSTTPTYLISGAQTAAF